MSGEYYRSLRVREPGQSGGLRGGRICRSLCVAAGKTVSATVRGTGCGRRIRSLRLGLRLYMKRNPCGGCGGFFS